MKNITKLTLILFISTSFFTPAFAKNSGMYSDWIKAKKISRFGSKLKREKLIPYDIQCKRGPGGKVWSNTLFRVRMVPASKSKVRNWSMNVKKAYDGYGGTKSRQLKAIEASYQSRSTVPVGASGINAFCYIQHAK